MGFRTADRRVLNSVRICADSSRKPCRHEVRDDLRQRRQPARLRASQPEQQALAQACGSINKFATE